VVSSPTGGQASSLLPDLEQAAPRQIGVATLRRGPRPVHRLGFESAVDNVGTGPLLVESHRLAGGSAMRADQLVLVDDGSTRRNATVGSVEYVRSEDHQHWHYLHFERYELRRASDFALVTPDRKTGFCLGDRYETQPALALPGKPAAPNFGDDCEGRRPDLRTLREGISVGYGDDYRPQLEGQYLDVTRVPAGRYYLVHRVNPNRRLQESSYGNNAASVLLELRWAGARERRPRIEVLGSCPDTEHCPQGGLDGWPGLEPLGRPVPYAGSLSSERQR
jgi:hypothetical protein